MTAQYLNINSHASKLEKAWHYIAVVPFYAIQKWFALFLITTGTLYASAMFNMQHGVFPPEVAYPLAVGIEWTYLSGLAYATELKNNNKWSTGMIIFGALTSGIFGILYIIGHYNVIPDHPDGWIAWILAMAHVLPLIALLLLYTLCKRDYRTEQIEIEKIELDRELEYRNRQKEREEIWRDEMLKISLDKERLVIETERANMSLMSKKPDKIYHCPNCNIELTQQQYAVANRWGHCPACKTP